MIRPLVTFALVSSAVAEPIDFSKQIRPILSENCFFCHGPDDKKREADLRLDDEAAAKQNNNDDVIAVVPGNPEKSALIQRIVSTDPDDDAAWWAAQPDVGPYYMDVGDAAGWLSESGWFDPIDAELDQMGLLGDDQLDQPPVVERLVREPGCLLCVVVPAGRQELQGRVLRAGPLW